MFSVWSRLGSPLLSNISCNFLCALNCSSSFVIVTCAMATLVTILLIQLLAIFQKLSKSWKLSGLQITTWSKVTQYLFYKGRSPDTGSPGPRSSGRIWLPSLSSTLARALPLLMLLSMQLTDQVCIPEAINQQSKHPGRCGPVICSIQSRFWGWCPPDSTR